MAVAIALTLADFSHTPGAGICYEIGFSFFAVLAPANAGDPVAKKEEKRGAHL